MKTKLALGTVQFGTVYGINNKVGQVSQDNAAKILHDSKDSSLNYIDTAQAYGQSEVVIGNIFRNSPKLSDNFKVVTKFIASPDASIEQLLDKSLCNLGVQHVYGFMYHRYSDYNNFPKAHSELLHLKERARIQKIGFSVYYPHEIEFLLKNKVPFDLVQLPYNIFDRRFEHLFQDLRNAGVEIHIRSVYLQGVVFMTPEALPSPLKELATKITALQSLSEKYSLSVSEICLGFAAANPLVDKIVVGIESLENLRDNLAIEKKQSQVADISHELLQLQESNEKLILPFNWK